MADESNGMKRSLGYGRDPNQTVFLPVGLESDEFKLDLFTEIKDDFGAAAITKIGTVQVNSLY